MNKTDQQQLVKETGYCIDSSSLFNLEWYHQDVFINLWNDLERLINDHKLVAPQFVIGEFDDIFPESYACKKWLKRHDKLFFMNGDVWEKAKLIRSRYPDLTKSNNPRSKADYYVIALAQYLGNWTVVTEEKTNRKISMKFVCSQMNIPCINLYNFFKKCKWKY